MIGAPIYLKGTSSEKQGQTKDKGARTTMVKDSLRKNLLILFIGFNPSPTSSDTGNPYAHRSNRFYRILHESGLTPVLHLPAEHRQMLTLYGYGFTNIVSRTTRRADELQTEELVAGRRVIMAKLKRFSPCIACFVGKGVYRPYSGRSQFSYGFQTDTAIKGIREFVGPATSGLVRMQIEEQIAIYRKLAQAVQVLRTEDVHNSNSKGCKKAFVPTPEG